VLNYLQLRILISANGDKDMTYTTDLEFYADEAKPYAGSSLEPDGWGGHFGTLFVCDDWDAAEWRVTTSHKGLYVAVNVELTGRKLHVLGGGQGKVRVKVTYVGDGTPDTEDRGWLYVDLNRNKANDYNPAYALPSGLRRGRELTAQAVAKLEEADAVEAKTHDLNRLTHDLRKAQRDARDLGLETVADGLEVALLVAEAEYRELTAAYMTLTEAARNLSREARWL
jgi:hypothetical protein